MSHSFSRTAWRGAIGAVAALGLALGGATAAYAAQPLDTTGELTHLTFHSEIVDRDLGMWVYTPPGYDPRKPLPATYAAPGGCADENAWFNAGLTIERLDAQFNEGDAPDQLVVLVSGAVGSDIFENPLADPFPDVIVNELVPFVEAHYKTIPNWHHRALGGNSCGGVQVLNTMVQYPGSFSEIGAWSTGWFPNVRALADTDPELRAALESPRLRNRTDYFEARIGGLDNVAGPFLPGTLDFFAGYGVEADAHVVYPELAHDYEAMVRAMLDSLSAFHS